MLTLFRAKHEHVPADALVETLPDPVEAVGPVRELDRPAYARRGMTIEDQYAAPSVVEAVAIAPPPVRPAPAPLTQEWARTAPTEPGMYWSRLTWAPECRRMVRLVPSRFGLVIADSGGRLARTAPCEWAKQPITEPE